MRQGMKGFPTGTSALRTLKPLGPFSAVIRFGRKTFWNGPEGWNWIDANAAKTSPLATYEGTREGTTK